MGRSWQDLWPINAGVLKPLCLVVYGSFWVHRYKHQHTTLPGCALDVFLVSRGLSPFKLISRRLTYPVRLAGIGVGAIDCVIPVWSAEVSSHSARGAFLALEFVMVRFS